MADFTSIPYDVYPGGGEYGLDPEYVDGRIGERHGGEMKHSTWQHILSLWFAQHRMEWNVRVLVSLRVRVSATRIRVPDVVVFDRNQAKDPVLTHAPIAVFEVLSPKDGLMSTIRKLADYEAMGIRNIFVIDPDEDKYLRYRKGGLLPLSSDIEPLTGWQGIIDWNAIKALRD